MSKADETIPKGLLPAVRSDQRTTVALEATELHEARVKAELDKVGPELYPLYIKNRKNFLEVASRHVIAYWLLGRDLKGIFQKHKKNGTKALAASLRMQPGDINAAWRLSQIFDTEDALRHNLLAYRTPQGDPLPWNMVRRLVSDDLSDERRAELIVQACTESWTADRLAQELQDELGSRRSGGRPNKLPGSLDDATSKWISSNRKWINVGESIFASDGGLQDLLVQAEGLGSDQQRKLLERLEQIETQLDRVAEINSRERGQALAAREHLQALLADKAIPETLEEAEERAAAVEEEVDHEATIPVAGGHLNGHSGGTVPERAAAKVAERRQRRGVAS